MPSDAATREPPRAGAPRDLAHRRAAGLALLGLLALAAPARATAPAFNAAALDTVLARHLRDGQVDYGALARDRAALDRFLASTERARPDDWPRAEQIAFWVNAYNARVLEGVIEHPGIGSVLEVGRIAGVPTLAFFRSKRLTAGRRLSLNDIEHGILRTRFADPHLHFVLNCASASCPVLPARALTGAALENELEDATRRFLSDSTRNRIDPARQLDLSMIFKWYGEDFQKSVGSVQAFIERNWPGHERFAPDLPTRYLPYDWTLNGRW